MKEVGTLLSRVTAIIGEEGLVLELEGILRKYDGLARRQRKAGRVERCALDVAALVRATDEPVERIAARTALERNLSQASVYRMARLLERDGLPVSPAAVLREMGRISRGIY